MLERGRDDFFLSLLFLLCVLFLPFCFLLQFCIHLKNSLGTKKKGEGDRARRKKNKARPRTPPLHFLSLFLCPFFVSRSLRLLYALGRGPCSRAPSATTATREQRALTVRLSSRPGRGGAQQAQASPHHELRRRRHRRRDGRDDDSGGGGG